MEMVPSPVCRVAELSHRPSVRARVVTLAATLFILSVTAARNETIAPALQTFAAQQGIHLNATDPVNPGGYSVGDTVVLWARATINGKARKQWLITVTRSRPPGSAPVAQFTRGKYLSNGTHFLFESREESIALGVAGPVDPSAGAHSNVKCVHDVVDAPYDYLRSGLKEAAAAHLALEACKRQNRERRSASRGKPLLYCADAPPPAAEAAQVQAFIAELSFSEEEQRAWTRGFVSLVSFFEVLNKSPATRELLDIVVQRPTAWNLLGRAMGNDNLTVELGGPSTSRLSPRTLNIYSHEDWAFDIPYAFKLGKTTLVKGAMIVGGAPAPLDLCGGILSITARHPTQSTTSLQVTIVAEYEGE
jgi:hypothetical protein